MILPISRWIAYDGILRACTVLLDECDFAPCKVSGGQVLFCRRVKLNRGGE